MKKYLIKFCKKVLALELAFIMLFSLSSEVLAQAVSPNFPSKSYFSQNSQYKQQGDILSQELQKQYQAKEIAAILGVTYEDYQKQIENYAKTNDIDMEDIDAEASWQSYLRDIYHYYSDYKTLSQIFSKKTFMEVITDASHYLNKDQEKINYDGKEYNRVSLLHAALHNLTSRNNTGYIKQGTWVFSKEEDQKYNPEQKIIVMNTIYEIISREGFYPQDRQYIWAFAYSVIANGKKYFDNEIYKADTLPNLSNASDRQKAQHGKDVRQEQANRVAMAISILPYFSKTSEEKAKSSKVIYNLAKKIMRYDYGSIGITTASDALIAIRTKDSLDMLYNLLVEDLYRSFGTEAVMWTFDSFSLPELANRADAKIETSIKNSLGQYHNEIAKRYYVYVDPSKNSAAKIRLAQKAEDNLIPYYGIVYTDILEEIGKNIGRNSSDAKVAALINRLAQKYLQDVPADKVNTNEIAEITLAKPTSIIKSSETPYKRETKLHTSIIVGILATTKYKSESLTKAAKIIYNGNWWDINEITQRDKNNIAAAYLNLSPKTFNQKKYDSYNALCTAKAILKLPDMFLQAFFLGQLIVSAPTIVVRLTSAASRFASRVRVIFKKAVKTKVSSVKPVEAKVNTKQPTPAQKPALTPAEPVKIAEGVKEPAIKPAVIAEPISVEAPAVKKAASFTENLSQQQLNKIQLDKITREVKYEILSQYYQRPAMMMILPFGLTGISKRLAFFLTNRAYLSDAKIAKVRELVDEAAASVLPDLNERFFSQIELSYTVRQRAIEKIQKSEDFTAQEKRELISHVPSEVQIAKEVPEEVKTNSDAFYENGKKLLARETAKYLDIYEKALRVEDYDLALEELKTAISLDYENAALHYKEAVLQWYHFGNKDAALLSMRLALKYDPENLLYRSILGRWTETQRATASKAEIAKGTAQVKNDILGKYNQKPLMMSVLPANFFGFNRRLVATLTGTPYLSDLKIKEVTRLIDQASGEVAKDIINGKAIAYDTEAQIKRQSYEKIHDSALFTAKEKTALTGMTPEQYQAVKQAEKLEEIAWEKYQDVISEYMNSADTKVDIAGFEEAINYLKQAIELDPKNPYRYKTLKEFNEDLEEFKEVADKQNTLAKAATKVKGDILNPYNQTPLMATYLHIFFPVSVFKDLGKRINAFLTNSPYLSDAKQAIVRTMIDEAAAELAAEGIHTWDIEEALKQRVFEKIGKSSEFSPKEKEELTSGKQKAASADKETQAQTSNKVDISQQKGKTSPERRAQQIKVEAEVYFEKANAAKSFRNSSRAFKFYEKALKMNPYYADCYYERALLEKEIGGDTYQQLAIQDLKEALSFAPNAASFLKYKNALLELNDNLISRGKGNKNLALEIQEIEDQKGLHKELQIKAEMAYDNAMNYLKQKRYKFAVKTITQSIEYNPKGEYYATRAKIKMKYREYYNDFSYEEIKQDYDEAIKRGYITAECYENRAYAKYRIGDYEGAVKDYDEALKLNKNNGDSYYYRALARRNVYGVSDKAALEDFKTAESYFKERGQGAYNRYLRTLEEWKEAQKKAEIEVSKDKTLKAEQAAEQARAEVDIAKGREQLAIERAQEAKLQAQRDALAAEQTAQAQKQAELAQQKLDKAAARKAEIEKQKEQERLVAEQAALDLEEIQQAQADKIDLQYYKEIEQKMQDYGIDVAGYLQNHTIQEGIIDIETLDALKNFVASKGRLPSVLLKEESVLSEWTKKVAAKENNAIAEKINKIIAENTGDNIKGIQYVKLVEDFFIKNGTYPRPRDIGLGLYGDIRHFYMSGKDPHTLLLREFYKEQLAKTKIKSEINKFVVKYGYTPNLLPDLMEPVRLEEHLLSLKLDKLVGRKKLSKEPAGQGQRYIEKTGFMLYEKAKEYYREHGYLPDINNIKTKEDFELYQKLSSEAFGKTRYADLLEEYISKNLF